VLNLVDLTNLIVVDVIGNGLCFGVSQLHEHVHAAIRLSHILQVAVGLEYFNLEQDSSDDDAVHDLEEQIHRVDSKVDVVLSADDLNHPVEWHRLHWTVFVSDCPNLSEPEVFSYFSVGNDW
jgi:hypothetical protein